MAKEALKQPILPTRRSAKRRYLYFDKPPSLWMAEDDSEDHTAILKASGRERPTRAGWLLAYSDELQIDANGSIGLQIPTRKPDVVQRYMQSLPGETKQRVVLK